MALARDADIRTTMPRPRKAAGDGERHVIAAPQSRDPRLPMPGAVLTREYKGRTIQVTVLPNDFDYDGQVYRSLSAVAISTVTELGRGSSRPEPNHKPGSD
jgi:hypothetical protein